MLNIRPGLKTLAYFAVFACLAGPVQARCVVSSHGDVSCDAKGYEEGDSPTRWRAQTEAPRPIFGMSQDRMNDYTMDLKACRRADPARLYRDSIMARTNVSEEVHKDLSGRLIVGIDHIVMPEENLKLKDMVSKDRILALWQNDSAWAVEAAQLQAKEAKICNPCAIAVLAEINDQMGRNWTQKNNTTWQLIVAGKYKEAIQVLGSTLWMLNTPPGVREFQVLLNSLPVEPEVCK